MRLFIALLLYFLFTQFADADSTCSPQITENQQQQTASIEITDTQTCIIGEVAYQAVIAHWLKTRNKKNTALTRFNLGQLNNYPWLSRYVVETLLVNRNWDTQNGKSNTGDDNAVIGTLLSEPIMRARLQWPFNGSAYFVTAISVVNITIAPAQTILPNISQPNAKVPTNAQVWLILEKN